MKITMQDCTVMPGFGVQTPLGRFMCLNATKDLVNSKMNEYLENKLISEFLDRTDKPFKNKWQTFMETDYSFMLACTGIEAR
jgi:hypothetical protein